jgi:hypothetical protein
MTATSDNSRELLAVAVASGKAIKDAAVECGLSASRAYHVSSSDEFKGRVAEIRREILDAAVGRLNEAATRAVSALVSILDTGEDKDRIVAAKAILSSLGPISELGELRSRLDRLERSRAGRVA